MNPRAWNWDDLRLFLAVLRRGSLSAAGRELGIDQSTASRRLTALEATLGVRLFDRVAGGLIATPVARDAVPAAERAEHALAEFTLGLAGADIGLTGTVRVALPDGIDSLLIAPRLTSFTQEYPDLAIELIASASLANLAKREADLALRFIRPTVGDLVYRRVGLLERGVWGVPALAKQGFARAPWIGWDEGPPDQAEWMRRHVPADRVKVRINRIDAQLAAVRSGVGLAVLHDVLAGLEPTLVRLRAEPIGPQELWLVGHRGLTDTPRVRAVWRFLEGLAKRELGTRKR